MFRVIKDFIEIERLCVYLFLQNELIAIAHGHV